MNSELKSIQDTEFSDDANRHLRVGSAVMKAEAEDDQPELVQVPPPDLTDELSAILSHRFSGLKHIHDDLIGRVHLDLVKSFKIDPLDDDSVRNQAIKQARTILKRRIADYFREPIQRVCTNRIVRRNRVKESLC